jgi:hypothetical protein
MGTDTGRTLDQPTVTETTPKHPRDKVMRIATMTTQLLDEVRAQPLDTAGLDRLRTLDTQIIGELLTDLTPDLRQELQRLALPLIRHTDLSDTEFRLAHAQLVGGPDPVNWSTATRAVNGYGGQLSGLTCGDCVLPASRGVSNLKKRGRRRRRRGRSVVRRTRHWIILARRRVREVPIWPESRPTGRRMCRWP